MCVWMCGLCVSVCVWMGVYVHTRLICALCECVYVCVVCVWVRVYRAVMHMCMHADECGMS